MKIDRVETTTVAVQDQPMDRLVGNWYVALEEKFQDKVSVFLDRKKVKSLSSKRPKLVSHIYEEWLERIFMVVIF